MKKRANNRKITKERRDFKVHTIQIEWRVIFGCWSGEFPFVFTFVSMRRLNTDNGENVPVVTC